MSLILTSQDLHYIKIKYVYIMLPIENVWFFILIKCLLMEFVLGAKDIFIFCI